MFINLLEIEIKNSDKSAIILNDDELDVALTISREFSHMQRVYANTINGSVNIAQELHDHDPVNNLIAGNFNEYYLELLPDAKMYIEAAAGSAIIIFGPRSYNKIMSILGKFTDYTEQASFFNDRINNTISPFMEKFIQLRSISAFQ